jgi:hypothetical protein
LAEASSAFIVTLVADDMGLTSLLSAMPSWAKLKFPDPSVSMAGRRFSVPSFVVVSTFSGPITSSPPSAVLSSSFCCCWLGLFFGFALFAMVSPKLFAAF